MTDRFAVVLGTQRGFRICGPAARLVAQAATITPQGVCALHRAGWGIYAGGARAKGAYELLDRACPQLMRACWLRLHEALTAAALIGDLHVRDAAEEALFAAVGEQLLSVADRAALMAAWNTLTA